MRLPRWADAERRKREETLARRVVGELKLATDGRNTLGFMPGRLALDGITSLDTGLAVRDLPDNAIRLTNDEHVYMVSISVRDMCGGH